jgi:hypothetical protein
MRSSLILAIGLVLCAALTAQASYTIPVAVTAGNITVGCTRTPSGGTNVAGYTIPAGYDEIDLYLTGMLGAAAGHNTDGGQVRINIIEGRWTAGSTGSFYVPSQAPGTLPFQSGTSANGNWMVPPNSEINFDAYVSSSTTWTNNAGGGGRGPQSSGHLYNYFSGAWYTTSYGNNLVYPANSGYGGFGTNSTYLAAMFVTSDTPDKGIAYDGKFSFTYLGGTIENVHFATVPEPGTVILLLGGLLSLGAYAWRKRK